MNATLKLCARQMFLPILSLFGFIIRQRYSTIGQIAITFYNYLSNVTFPAFSNVLLFSNLPLAFQI
jgi:hypothetical protein